MNLADAIRRAAQSTGVPLAKPAVTPAEPASAVVPAAPVVPTVEESAPLFVEPVREVVAEAAAPQVEEVVLAKEQEQVQPLEAQEVPHGHNIVRLELVLNPEQLKGFFGAVIASQHSVLTLREAAGLLRVSQSALERLADEGEVPGMQVDGKWRFTRQALEDWLSTHPRKKEA
jgi:excisionase family DNA binding protein